MQRGSVLRVYHRLKLGPRLIPHLKQVVALCISAMDAERQFAAGASIVHFLGDT
jgi:hypothetical protein